MVQSIVCNDVKDAERPWYTSSVGEITDLIVSDNAVDATTVRVLDDPD